MKTRFTFLTILVLVGLLTACNPINSITPTPQGDPLAPTTSVSAPPTVTVATAELPTEIPTTTPEIFNHAPIEGVIGDKAREDLASRPGMDLASISVAQISSQDWPDACLGLAPAAGQECAKFNVPGWRIVLNAAGHTHEYRATADGQLISYSGPVSFAAPETCTIKGTSSIFSPEDRYCFAYPIRFHRNDEHGPIGIYGPAYGRGPEPLYAALTIEINPLSDGQTLETAVDTFLAQLGSVPLPQTRQKLTVANEPAILLEVVPGMLGSRDVFVAHNGKLFHLTFWPAPSVAAETASDVEDLYQVVLNSWNFQP